MAIRGTSVQRRSRRIRREAPPRARSRRAGQALVEFSLVIPLFLVLLMAVIEFAFAFNASLAIGYASRDAALLAAEAGNGIGADCVILQKVEQDVSAPADPAQITQVEIYWSDQNGNLKNGGHNIYTRGAGTMTCVYPGGTSITVPYGNPPSPNTYPDSVRCNVVAGCGGSHTPSVDTIGVKITYNYLWHTPMPGMMSFLGSGAQWTGTGWLFTRSNAMRMEPVL